LQILRALSRTVTFLSVLLTDLGQKITMPKPSMPKYPAQTRMEFLRNLATVPVQALGAAPSCSSLRDEKSSAIVKPDPCDGGKFAHVAMSSSALACETQKAFAFHKDGAQCHLRFSLYRKLYLLILGQNSEARVRLSLS